MTLSVHKTVVVQAADNCDLSHLYFLSNVLSVFELYMWGSMEVFPPGSPLFIQHSVPEGHQLQQLQYSYYFITDVHGGKRVAVGTLGHVRGINLFQYVLFSNCFYYKRE